MDTVSKVMSWIYTWIERNNRQIEDTTPRIGDPEEGDLVEDARMVRVLADQNEVLMLLAKALHETENRNIRGVFGSDG